MLEPDDNNSNNQNTEPSATDTAAPTKAPRKRAPRKAAKAAAEPATEPIETAAGEPEAAPPAAPARKRAAAKAPAKAAGATPRKRTARAAQPEQPELTETGDAGSSGDREAAEPAKAAKPTRKRAPRKAAQSAAGDAPTSEDAQSSADTAAEPAGPPGVLFVAPGVTPAEPPAKRTRRAAKAPAGPPPAAEAAEPEPGETDLTVVEDAEDATAEPEDVKEAAVEEASGARRRRRRGRRGRGGGRADGSDSDAEAAEPAEGDAEPATAEAAEPDGGDGAEGGGTHRRRRRRRSGGGGDNGDSGQAAADTAGGSGSGSGSGDDGVRGVKGSTRLEAKRQRRREGRDTGRRRPPILSEAEFLARREAVDRVMAVRQSGERTQIAVLEDDVLVEHYVTRASATSYVGNVYLGRVQNVLPSMEAAFVDIGKGRNGVLYAGEVNWEAAGLEGKSRNIETALSSGDVVLVQVTKDPIGHKGARLTSQISLPGRFLVYVPGGGMTGISRKLPDTERHRLKSILKKIVPEDAGVIIRTAAEGASEEDLTRDVDRLKAQWETISTKAQNTKSAPTLVHGEPDLAIRVVRDVFNEDFKKLVVQGEQAWKTISEYIGGVAPDLVERLERHMAETDLFHDLRVDEQLMKGLDRKVWLPSGGSLIIDRTEAMTVIDVNTGKFVGTGGNLEQTVTRNNLEAAEEIVRQLRLRDVGGIVVIDFIDMVLESNRELVLRRLTECLGRDRTKHQVAEVTSLGLVQMTRKRVGEGLLEAFSEQCPTCNGRGVLVHGEPVDKGSGGGGDEPSGDRSKSKRKRGGAKKAEAPEDPAEDPAAREKRLAAMAAIHKAAHPDEDVPGELEIEAAVAALDAEPADLESYLGETVDVVEQVPEPAPSEPAAAPEPEPAPSEHDAAAETEPELEPVAAAPARPRRRRAASRPAGPPVTDGEGQVTASGG
ncbi:MAG TPA: Rne/Rng family ribonuclease [Jatrophihabitantaceae bacterium]|nr:Rne/Rng family ribonuclease [Jatrophihabitantaceae bacterium]